MQCATCPLVLPCWGGKLDALSVVTLCTTCQRLIVADPEVPDAAYPAPQYFVFKCEQRNYQQLRPQLKKPFPLYGQKVMDPGPGLIHQLQVGVCLICSNVIHNLGGKYVDLDEEQAAAPNGEAVFQLQPRRPR